MLLSITIDRKSSQADGFGMDGRLAVFCAYHQAQYRELRERETQFPKIPFLGTWRKHEQCVGKQTFVWEYPGT